MISGANKVKKNDVDRKSWQKATDINTLDSKTLLAATILQQQCNSPRKAWDLPHETILKAFELAQISPTNTSEASKATGKLKRCDTFVVAKQSSRLQSVLNQTDNDDADIVVFAPEKLATLKATKNLLLGVTLGQFDSKTRMLRTCSEPDMTKLFEVQSDGDEEQPATEDKEALASIKHDTKRLVKSLEDLDQTLMTKISQTDKVTFQILLLEIVFYIFKLQLSFFF